MIRRNSKSNHSHHSYQKRINPERDFKGIWIPKEIWLNPDLTLHEKMFLIEIDSLDGDRGCYASNSHFSNFFGVSTQRCSQIINSINKKGYIGVVLHRKGKQVIKRTIRVSNLFDRGIKFIKGGYQINVKGINTIRSNTYKKEPLDGDGVNGNEVDHLLPNKIDKTIEPIEPKRKRYPKHIKPDQFDKWWVHYPRKAQKGKAKTAWNKLCSKRPKTDTPSLPQIVRATKKQKKTKQWIKSNGTYIPYPSTYLNNMRWLDDIDEMNKEYEYNSKPKQDLHAPSAVRADENKYKEPTDIRH